VRVWQPAKAADHRYLGSASLSLSHGWRGNRSLSDVNYLTPNAARILLCFNVAPAENTAQLMADIFFSYKREDRSLVEPVVRRLEREGFTVWWDPTIVPGELFQSTIRHELETARCVIVAWSKNSIRSGWVHDEANFGRKRGILVPVNLDGIEPPLGFGNIHTVLLNEEGDIQNLLNGVRRLVQSTSIEPLRNAPQNRPKKLFLAGAIGVVLILGLVGLAITVGNEPLETQATASSSTEKKKCTYMWIWGAGQPQLVPCDNK